MSYLLVLVERRSEVQCAPTLLEDLGGLFRDRTHSDTVLTVGGREIFAHKAVLARRCPYFARVYDSGMQESIPPCSVEVTLFRYEAMEAFLEYLYTDRTTFPSDITLELLQVASFYDVPALKAACADRLGALITLDTVLRFYAAAELASAPILRHKCVNFLMRNFADVTLGDGLWALEKTAIRDIMTAAAQSSLPYGRPIPLPRLLVPQASPSSPSP
jgi:hypothetical protein